LTATHLHAGSYPWHRQRRRIRVVGCQLGDPIPADAINRLFQSYYRVSAHDAAQGLGLGLPIASEIARAHGGKIEVASMPRETRFTFRMRCDEVKPPPGDSSARRPCTSLRCHLDSKRTKEEHTFLPPARGSFAMSAPSSLSDNSRYEQACDQAIAMCDGNLRSTIKALIMANEYLEAELEELQAAISAGCVPAQSTRTGSNAA
jgi:hypothetical protein